jgi:hypothetical protein
MTARSITAKYPSLCPLCGQPILAGTQVLWERGAKAIHTACPTGAKLAKAVLDTRDLENRAEQITGLCFVLATQADDLKPEDLAHVRGALDYIEDDLTLAYERQAQRATATSPDPQDADRLARLAAVEKGIYRVSLNGQEKRYGVDHVNVVLVPSTKTDTVKVGEWQGVEVGFIGQNGRLNYWKARQASYWSEAKPAVDPTNPRVRAVAAAVDVILGSADPLEYAKAYAVASSQCYRCGADLVDEKSRERLLGPDCFRAVKKGA